MSNSYNLFKIILLILVDIKYCKVNIAFLFKIHHTLYDNDLWIRHFFVLLEYLFKKTNFSYLFKTSGLKCMNAILEC